jgi:LmbE family N-acetylglucosaminyl deacetylase
MLERELGGKRVVAIVPHQDDEVIGMGGHLAVACRVAASVHVVLVTDGAADSGVKRVCGLAPCCEIAQMGDSGDAGRAAHDSGLVDAKEGRKYHRCALRPPFAIAPDAERAPGFSCDEWGRQRLKEFRQVCATLGVTADHVIAAYWDPASPERIKDGQVACGGEKLEPAAMSRRYASVARHYFEILRPEVVFTMGPYEFMAPPNDHWAMACGVEEAARDCGVQRVFYAHSGVHYRHVRSGGAHIGRRVELPTEAWDAKRRALHQYMRWDPDCGWFATAWHSVSNTFEALLQGGGRYEYMSDRPE